MRLGVVFNPLWLYQLERMVLGKTKPSICCGCHGWRIIALLLAAYISVRWGFQFESYFMQYRVWGFHWFLFNYKILVLKSRNFLTKSFLNPFVIFKFCEFLSDKTRFSSRQISFYSIFQAGIINALQLSIFQPAQFSS